MGVLDRVNARAARRGGRAEESRYGIDTWISDYLIPSAGQFTYGNQTYPFGTGLPGSLAGNRAAEIANSLPGVPAGAAVVPAGVRRADGPRPGAEPGQVYVQEPAVAPGDTPADVRQPGPGLLERPWPNGTTGELVSRMEWHAGLAGNAFVHRQPDRLRVLRPDWTAIIYGSQIGAGLAVRGAGRGADRLRLREPGHRRRGPSAAAPEGRGALGAAAGSGDDGPGHVAG